MENIVRFYTLDGHYIGAFAGDAQPPEGSIEVPGPIDIMPTEQQLAAGALMQRDELLKAAAVRIAPLEDAVDLGLATEAKIELLTDWKRYRIALDEISEQGRLPSSDCLAEIAR